MLEPRVTGTEPPAVLRAWWDYWRSGWTEGWKGAYRTVGGQTFTALGVFTFAGWVFSVAFLGWVLGLEAALSEIVLRLGAVLFAVLFFPALVLITVLLIVPFQKHQRQMRKHEREMARHAQLRG